VIFSLFFLNIGKRMPYRTYVAGALRFNCSNPNELFNTKNIVSHLTAIHALPITLIFPLSSPSKMLMLMLVA
jgi:hypothetical protein